MKSSWPDQVGPELSFPPDPLLSDVDTATGGETEGDNGSETDSEWMALSNDIVKTTNHIEQSIEEEAEAHKSRPDRTKWELSHDKSDATNVGGGRNVTGKARREHRKLMAVLRKKYVDEIESPEMLTEPSATTSVTEGPLKLGEGEHRNKNVTPLFPFPACVS